MREDGPAPSQQANEAIHLGTQLIGANGLTLSYRTVL